MSVDMRDVRVGGTAVRGVPAKAIVAPADLGEATEVMLRAAARDEAVAFLGGGTELGFGYPPERVDLLVKTARLGRVVEYSPADMVVEVEAGITLAALQKRLGAHGQRLAIDVPYPELATIGGLVATNAFGPRRARFGTLRDAIVGVSLIRADGMRVRGGGKVVKNVAGFDLPKLAVGSLGSLGMIATATFRLHPVPETALAVRIAGCDGPRLAGLVRAMVADQLEPSMFVAVPGSARRTYDAYVLFEGFATGVDEQAARLEKLAHDGGGAAERLDDAALPARLDENARTHGDLRLRLAVPPSDFAALERDALAPLCDALAEPLSILYPSLGIAFVSGYAADVAGTVAQIAGARQTVEALRGNLIVLDVRDRTIAGDVDPYGAVPPSLFLMRRLKERFDPSRRLNRGRFLGGL